MPPDYRARVRKKLHALYLPIYDAMCGLLDARWQPYSGLRTAADQAALYAQGRDRPGRKRTDARPWQSPHQYGMASDWAILKEDGSFWWPEFDHELWEVYRNACDKAGAQCLRWERPHNELPIKISWKEVGEAYKLEGLSVALRLIEEQRR